MAANNLLSLDVGEVRVGAAMARADVRLPVALRTLLRSQPDFWDQLAEIIAQNDIGQIIVGLPRGLDGQETAQTASAHRFGQELALHTALPTYWQDEAVTSVKAEEVLKASGKPYTKADIDAQAACYILADFLESARVNT